MKCEHVQSIVVEYSEGALCVADELCVDIHMVQCESCRAEARKIALIERALALDIDRDAVLPPHTAALLDKLDALAATQSRDRSRPGRAGAVILRTVVFSIVAVVLLVSGAMTWEREATVLFGLMPVDAATARPLVETVRPLAGPAELAELYDLNELTGSNEPATRR